MKPKKAITDYWFEHYMNRELHLCSLCGNSGLIDTTETAISPIGYRPGRVNFCICPNGQALREQTIPRKSAEIAKSRKERK